MSCLLIINHPLTKQEGDGRGGRGWSLTPLYAGRLNPFSIIIFIILIYMTQNAFAFIVVGCAFRVPLCALSVLPRFLSINVAGS